MATRKLPNVYTELNDLSALIEGNDSLTVGITLRANRGPVNEAYNIQDSSDFLTRYTFTGKPSAKQDSTYFDIIELLKVSNNIYVSRASNNPLYGGLIVKKEQKIGDLVGVAENNHARILLNGNVANKVVAKKFIRIATPEKSYRYFVKSAEYVTPMTQVLLTEEVEEGLIEALATAKANAKALAKAKAEAEGLSAEKLEELKEQMIAGLRDGSITVEAGAVETADERATRLETDGFTDAEITKLEKENAIKAGEKAEMETNFDVFYCVEPVQLNTLKITDAILTATAEANEEKGYKGGFVIEGNVTPYFIVNDRFRVENCISAVGVSGASVATQYYTVALTQYDQQTAMTTVFVKEPIDGIYRALENTGTEEDPVYTKAGVVIYRDSIAEPEQFTFAKDDLCLITGIDQGAYNSDIGIAIESGNEVNFDEGAGMFKVYVHNMLTGTDLEEFLVSMNPEAKSIDGTNVFIKDIVEQQSQYIKVVTPDIAVLDTEAVPASTPQRELDVYMTLGGGYDGDEITVQENLQALEIFGDKTIPVSILVNGNNENVLYQSAMIAICEKRMDCFAFLRTLKSHEKLSIPTQRVKQAVNYKKNILKSTAYTAGMYGPHITVYDNYNARNVVVGADSIACRQWLKTINEKGFPYAAAGPQNGTIANVTVDWKIGDESAEAAEFNDASINMLVYDARQKYYYFNTQNTLQLANSAFRNVGAVLNVLNIKENLARDLKQYIQLPIDDQLQEAITRTIETYMDGCKSASRVSDYKVNNLTTKQDESNNELHFMLTLAPAYYAQKIFLAMNVVNATFDFKVLQSV